LQDRSTDFEFLPIDVSLGRCQRYFHRIKSGNASAGGIVGLGVQTTTTSAYFYTSISPPMRVTPTLTFNDLICSDSVSFDKTATLQSVDGTGDSIYYNAGFAVSGAQFRAINIRATSNTSGSLDMSSEL
jgi:hypothetical protein